MVQGGRSDPSLNISAIPPRLLHRISDDLWFCRINMVNDSIIHWLIRRIYFYKITKFIYDIITGKTVYTVSRPPLVMSLAQLRQQNPNFRPAAVRGQLRPLSIRPTFRGVQGNQTQIKQGQLIPLQLPINYSNEVLYWKDSI